MAVTIRQDYLFYRKYLFNLMEMYKNRKDVKVFLELLLSLAAISVFAIFAIRPTLITVASLSTEVKSKEEIVAQLSRKMENIAQAQTLYEQTREKLVYMDQSVPSKPLPNITIKQIEGLAIRNSLLVENFDVKNVPIAGDTIIEKVTTTVSPDEPTQEALPENADEMAVNFTVSGEYVNLLTFLKDVEFMRRPFYIDNVGFNSIVTSRGEKLVLTFEGRLPYIYTQ